MLSLFCGSYLLTSVVLIFNETNVKDEVHTQCFRFKNPRQAMNRLPKYAK